MSERWTISQVDAAAPDDQVRKAGRKLAIPTPWNDVGITGSLLFGRCQGSGKNPYQVSIDLAGPRWKCSCPSRKFPCKHCVALLYLWADGKVDEQGVSADFAREWAEKASAATTRAAAKNDGPRTPEQQAAAAQRAADREARIDAGLADLDLFLHDLSERGLAADTAGRPRRFEEQAARMVDAQAPGIATRLRELAEITDATPDWTIKLSEGLGTLHLLVRAWQNRTSLDEAMGANVRRHLGFSQRAEDTLATPGIADDWIVVGMRDSTQDRVSVRRVWLWGAQSGRPAMVLFFAAGGAALTSNLYPGTAVNATLHFQPGNPALRAVVGQRTGADGAVNGWYPNVMNVGEARTAWRDALAADPWLEELPVLLIGRLQVPAHDGQFGLVDCNGESIALCGPQCWTAALITGGNECVLAGEICETGFAPSALLHDGRVSVL